MYVTKSTEAIKEDFKTDNIVYNDQQPLCSFRD